MNSRLLTALVALPVLILSIILPYLLPQFPQANWLFVLIAALALGAGLFEFFTLTKKLELKADASIAYIGAAIFPCRLYFRRAPQRAGYADLIVCFIFNFTADQSDFSLSGGFFQNADRHRRNVARRFVCRISSADLSFRCASVLTRRSFPFFQQNYSPFSFSS